MNELLAVMAVDPGLTTGWSQGVFDTSKKNVKEVIAHSQQDDVLNSLLDCGEIKTSDDPENEPDWEVFTAMKIVNSWSAFCRQIVWSVDLPAPSIKKVLVIEDWRARLPMRSASRVVLSPVRIASLVIGMLLASKAMRGLENQTKGLIRVGDLDVLYQAPVDAKSYASDERLKDWGLWVKGSDHARDANRHMALVIAKTIKR